MKGQIIGWVFLHNHTEQLVSANVAWASVSVVQWCNRAPDARPLTDRYSSVSQSFTAALEIILIKIISVAKIFVNEIVLICR